MSEQDSRIEQLKKGLYSRKGSDILHKEVHFHTHEANVDEVWKNDGTEGETRSPTEAELYSSDSSSFFKNVLWAAVVFFILALGFAFYMLYAGKNTVSADNVNILVTGPISVTGGEPVSLDVQVQNNNDIQLQLVDLSVEFPAGTANATDVTQSLKRYRELIGDIKVHTSAGKKINAVFFGEENSKKQIKITAEYRVDGSNAVFSKEKDYDIVINSSPVSMTIDSLKEVNANQETSFTLTVTSNSSQVIKNLLVRGEYPFGFNFKQSNPAPSFDNNVWKIGDLPPGSKKIVKITGQVIGQDEEERVFHFNLGIVNPRDEKTIGTTLFTALSPILVKKPFITTTLMFDGDSSSGDHASELDRSVQATISWVNNTPSDIIDSVIKVQLGGTVLDKTSITTDGGFYRSSDNTINWDRVNTQSLAIIHAGDGGHVNFSFIPRIPTFVGISGVKNPEVSVDVSFQGRRVSEGNVPQSLASTASRKVKMASLLGFTSRSARIAGPFTNTGPFPPKVDKETSYTVIWTISNTSSTIAGAQVKAILPSSVKWLRKVSPDGERINYDQVSGEITWNPGDIAAGAGYTLPAREVAFQVAFTPSINQIGQVPTILGTATLTGTDRFSGSALQNIKEAVTTNTTSDSQFKVGDGTVQE